MLIPQSLYMSVQRPRCAIKRSSAVINVGIYKSDASSMCTLVVTMHTNMHKYAFVTPSWRNRGEFILNGYAKSTLIFPNGLICTRRCCYKSPMSRWGAHGNDLKHGIQRWSFFLITYLANKTLNYCCMMFCTICAPGCPLLLCTWSISSLVILAPLGSKIRYFS